MKLIVHVTSSQAKEHQSGLGDVLVMFYSVGNALSMLVLFIRKRMQANESKPLYSARRAQRSQSYGHGRAKEATQTQTSAPVSPVQQRQA